MADVKPDDGDNRPHFEVDTSCPSCRNSWNDATFGGSSGQLKNKAAENDVISCGECRKLFRVVADGIREITTEDLSIHEASFLISKGLL